MVHPQVRDPDLDLAGPHAGRMGVAAEAVTDIIITHAHFDHMGSIAEFPNARIYIQKSELLTWYEAIALPKRFGTYGDIDPDNLRTALEASIEHRVTLIDGDKDNVLPGIHVRLGSGHTIGQQFVSSKRRGAGRDLRRLRLFPHASHRPQQRRRLHAAQQRHRQRLGTAQDHRQDQRRDRAAISSKLVVLHDIERWKGLPVVKEVEGFRIVEVSRA